MGLRTIYMPKSTEGSDMLTTRQKTGLNKEKRDDKHMYKYTIISNVIRNYTIMVLDGVFHIDIVMGQRVVSTAFRQLH